MEEFDDDFGDLYADVEVQASSAMDTVNGVSQLPIKKVETLGNGIGDCHYDEFSMEPKSGIFGNNGSNAPATANELTEEEDVMVEEEEIAEVVEGEEKVEGEEGEGEVEEDVVEGGDNEDKWSDSEDELNIVLDDDDDGLLEKDWVSSDHVSKNDFIGNDHMSNRGWFDYNGNEEVESDKNAAEQNPSRGRIGGGYNLQNKNMRLQSPAFPCEKRANKSLSKASYSFKSGQDESEDVGFAHHRNASSLAFERGDNFSLPRSRTILDVNIDSLNNKPWRHPGADITDFFNFGFNENSWKQYCNRLNTYRYQMSGGRHSSKSLGHNKELKVGTELVNESHKVGPEIIANPVQLEFEMISGRAIQVEECVIERQPSQNRWGPLDRDSDVVIQIDVHDDLKEDCSNSAKEDVDQTEFEKEDIELDEAEELLCFSSASEDELSSVEEYDERSGNSVLESGKSCKPSPTSGSVSKHLEIDHDSGQIAEGDVFHRRKWTDAVPIDEEMNTFIELGRSDGRRLVDATPSVPKPHFNHGDQSPHSVTPPKSYRHSDYGYGTCAGFRKSSNKLNSPNYLPEVRDSVSYGCYLSEDSKRYSGTSKPRGREFCSSSRSALQRDLSYHGNKPIHMDGDASHLSVNEWFSDSRHSTNYKKHNGLGSYESKRKLYYTTANPDYGDHILSDYDVRDHYMKRPNWKGSRSEHDLGLNNREIMNGKKKHFVQKVMLEHKKRRKDIFFDDRRHALQNMESQPHDVFKHWHSNSGCYLDSEGGDQWKTGKYDWQSSNEVEDDDLLVQSNYESRLTQGDHRNPMSSTVGIGDCIRHKGDHHLSYTKREVESSAGSIRRRDEAFNGLHDVQYAEYVDDKVGCTRFSPRDSQNLPHSTCTQRLQEGSSPRDCTDQSHSRNRKNVTWAERSCNNDHLVHYSSFDTNVRMRNVDTQDYFERRDHEQYGESCWNDEHYNKRDPSQKNIDPQNAPNLSGNHIKHMQSGRGRFRMTRGHKRGQFFQNSKFIHNADYEKKLPRFRSSVDSQLVGVDRKSTGRSFRGRNMCNARSDYIGNNNGTKLKTLDDSDVDYLNKVSHHENFEVDARQNVGKQHVKVSSVEHNESEDIEEGQILTEDLKKRVKKDLRQIRENKNMYHENTTDGNVAFKGHENTTGRNEAFKRHENATDLKQAFKENPKMRDILAKMERRRERFKQPIALKKDAEKAAPMALDAAIETCNSNLQRPARKRRWDGTQHKLLKA